MQEASHNEEDKAVKEGWCSCFSVHIQLSIHTKNETHIDKIQVAHTLLIRAMIIVIDMECHDCEIRAHFAVELLWQKALRLRKHMFHSERK